MSSLPDPGAVLDFETWFRQSGRLLLRLAYFCTGEEKLAEDIAQEAAIKVFKAWADDKMRELILTGPGYLRTIVVHCFLDHIKVRSRTGLSEVGLDVERHDRAGIENDRSLRIAVLELDGDERDMIILRYYNDLTTKDAGIQLGLSASQAYRLHRKALAHLAGLLAEGEA